MAQKSRCNTTAIATKSKPMNVTSIKMGASEEEEESSTDFEEEEEGTGDVDVSVPKPSLPPPPNKQKVNLMSAARMKEWEHQFLHLLGFSEDILPTALYDPLKWCHVSIQEALLYIAKAEEIVRNTCNGGDEKVLEMALEAWKQQTPTSKSRLRYSLYLYKHAGDVFYFAFYLNRAILPEVREHLDPAFEAQFGSRRLAQTRALLKLYLGQFSQIEDFLSILPELYRSELLATVICDYLNPLVQDEGGREKIEQAANELLSSNDYHENQVTLMMLTRDDCLFKPIILDCMFKYMMITHPNVESAPRASTSSSSNMKMAKTETTRIMEKEEGANSYCTEADEESSERTRYRLKLFLDAEPELLAKACVSTENLPTSLFEIIALGLDTISRNVMLNRFKIFEDFRPPLFEGNDPSLSLPKEFLRFFRKMEETPGSLSLLERVKRVFGKSGQSSNFNLEFWIELFAILSE